MAYRFELGSEGACWGGDCITGYELFDSGPAC
jgi:hypothetical protein